MAKLFPGGKLNPGHLEIITWSDIQPVLDQCTKDPEAMGILSEYAWRTTHSPALYLGSLVVLSRGDDKSALELMSRIPAESIPPEFLYAPYRLHLSLNPGMPNPCRLPILAAISNGQMNALVEARVFANEGNLTRSLEAYLRTDPVAWRDIDGEVMILMRNYSGLSREVDRMLAAALRGGRLTPALDARFRNALAIGILEDTDYAAIANNVRDQLAGNETLQGLAATGVIRQLETRKDFISQDYASLLNRYRSTDPQGLTDENLLLLVLASARISDRPAFTLWSRELRRRFPEQEVATWLQQLENDIK